MKAHKYICILLGLMFFIAIPFPAYALGTMTAFVPKGCHVESFQYSIGDGDKAIQYLEVLCSFPDKSQKIYIDRIVSIGGMLNLGKTTLPSRIEFKYHNKDSLEVD